MSPSQHWTSDEIGALLDDAPDTYGVRIASVKLVGDETAWNPAVSDNRQRIGAPAAVFYTRYADGGIEARVIRP